MSIDVAPLKAGKYIENKRGKKKPLDSHQHKDNHYITDGGSTSSIKGTGVRTKRRQQDDGAPSALFFRLQSIYQVASYGKKEVLTSDNHGCFSVTQHVSTFRLWQR